MTNKISALLIAGPTASGKSDLAINLALSLDGVIVNADSMQVYQDLRILTARPNEADLRKAPHKLYGHVDGAENYSTGKWLGDVEKVLEACRDKGKLPIIIGGTGLYFKALLEGLAEIPEISESIRQKYRKMLIELGPQDMYEKLSAVDPDLARCISPSDGQRIVRGLEVFEATEKPLSLWHQQGEARPLLDVNQVYPLVVTRSREEIYDRCDLRVDDMLAAGALEEVRALKERCVNPAMPVMKVIGVPQLMSYLDGDMLRDEAVEKTKTLTRRYAKRQLTWLRRNMIAWNRTSTQESERISLDILSKLRENG